MLLVDHGEASERTAVFLDSACVPIAPAFFPRQRRKRGFALLLRLASGEPRRFQPQGTSHSLNLRKCCSRDFRRRHDRGLQAVLDGAQRGEHGNDGLALPTSPCNSRCIGCGLRKISSISFHTVAVRESMERQSLDQNRGVQRCLSGRRSGVPRGFSLA